MSVLSIRLKLMLTFLCIILLTGGLIGATTFVNWAKSSERDAMEISMQGLRTKSNVLESFIEERNRYIHNIWFNRDVQQYLRITGEPEVELHNRIVDLINNEIIVRSHIEAIILYRTDGRSITAAQNKIPKNPGRVELPYALPEHTRIHIVEPHDSGYFYGQQEPVFSVLRGITPNGEPDKPAHYLVLDISLNAIRDMFGQSERKMEQVYIINEEGRYLFHPERLKIGLKMDELHMDELTENKGYVLQGRGAAQTLHTYVRGERTGWYYLVSIPYTDIQSNVIKNRDFTIFILFTASCFALLIAIGISYRISRPLLELKAMIGMVEKGNFKVEVPVRSKDEIGYLASSFNRMVQRLDRLTVQVYAARLKQTEAALKQLQMQINPHFLYNTLDSISAMAQMEGVRTISRIVHLLSQLFRYNINDKEYVTYIGNEMKHIRMYLEIQKVRFGDRFESHILIDPETEHLPILKFTLQPLVENAFQHGLEAKVGKGTIWITTRLEEGALIIRVSDDGAGMDVERRSKIETFLHKQKETGPLTLDPSTEIRSIGLANVHQRLYMHFGERYGMNIHSSLGNGTTIEIRIENAVSTAKGENEA